MISRLLQQRIMLPKLNKPTPFFPGFHRSKHCSQYTSMKIVVRSICLQVKYTTVSHVNKYKPCILQLILAAEQICLTDGNDTLIVVSFIANKIMTMLKFLWPLLILQSRILGLDEEQQILFKIT